MKFAITNKKFEHLKSQTDRQWLEGCLEYLPVLLGSYITVSGPK